MIKAGISLAAHVPELIRIAGRPGTWRDLRAEAFNLARLGYPSFREPRPSAALLAAAPVLAPLGDEDFARLCRLAVNRGLVMRDEVGPSGVPVYRTVHPAKAIGSKLDKEVAAFRDEQRRRRPADAPGQMAMFD